MDLDAASCEKINLNIKCIYVISIINAGRAGWPIESARAQPSLGKSVIFLYKIYIFWNKQSLLISNKRVSIAQ